MSSAVTSFGLKIENFTRYNTNDLLALINRYESLLLQHGLRNTATYFPEERNPNSESEGKFLIRDYAPSSPYTDRYKWNGRLRETTRERNYCYSDRDYRCDGGEIAIIPPGKIYVDPIEALTSMEADEPSIPSDMLTKLWMTINETYLEGHQRRDEKTSLAARSVPTDLSVRITTKRASRRPKEAAAQVARKQLGNKLWTVTYYQERGARELTRALRGITIANKHAARAGMPEVDASQLEELLKTLDELTSTARKYKDHVNSIK